MSGHRVERLSEQIREELSLIIDGDLEDPRVGLATITEVRVTPDLSSAKIFVSVVGTDEEVAASLEALNHAAGFIRHQLGHALRIKRTPELRFVHDHTVRTAERIEQILQEEEEKVKARERETSPVENESPDSESN
jgi:ribosome-binding factor A